MELPNIGKQCANNHCRQLDFLPLQCRCGMVFCSEHLTSHVPICEKSRFLSDDELKKIKHILTCSKEGCKEKSVVPLICQRCKKHYCIQHRHLTECKEKSEGEINKEKERYAEPVRQFNEAKAVVDKQVENNIAESKKKSKNKELAVKLQLMKIKNKTTGQMSIPTADRIYFNVRVVPDDESVEKSVPVFVSKAWSLGRTIDAVADECKLQNNNNKGSQKKLRLFQKDDSKILSSDLSVLLSTLLLDKVIVDGEDLIIKYVDDSCNKQFGVARAIEYFIGLFDQYLKHYKNKLQDFNFFVLTKMYPSICAQTPLYHVDYGVLLLASKSVDYRTSTSKNHDFRPSIPQYFDCRVKARIKPELLEKDIALRNEYKSTYNKEYEEKHNDKNTFQYDQAINCRKVDYTRTAQEKIFMNPPPLKPPKISEMKDSYPVHYWRPHHDTFVNFTCEMPDTYRAVQPDINPGEKGFYKLLDIYLTENRSKYVPFTTEQLAKAQEDFITIYNASGKHKGLKDEMPGKLHGHRNIYDKRIFKVEFPNRFLSNAPKKVPHSGMMSEYQSGYPKPAYSDFYPYLLENGIYFPDSLSGSGPWQDLSPPAMYCSENCHIGTGWPVSAVVDINGSEETSNVSSKQCCTKI